MQFTNSVIPVEALPKIEDVELQPLEPSYLKVERIVYIISTLFVLAVGVALFYFVEDIQLPLLVGGAALAFVILTLLGWAAESLSFRFSGYAIRQHDILYRSGWFIRKTRIVPIHRIQHVSVQSGPIERKYKLASVSIFTASSDHSDFSIRGLTQERAQQIKEWISQQLNARTQSSH